jgi:NAD-dependent deacetylase
VGTVARDGTAERLAELIRESRCTVALTGAGISVPSGIPDFRSPGSGIWENVDPMEVAHIDAFRRDPERFWSFYRPRFEALDDKQPNPAHQALAQLEAEGLLDAVVTQNVEGALASRRFSARQPAVICTVALELAVPSLTRSKAE